MSKESTTEQKEINNDSVYEFRQYTDEDYQEIAEILGIEGLSQEVKESLYFYLNEFQIRVHRQEMQPKHSKIKRTFKRIRDKVKHLKDEFDKLDEYCKLILDFHIDDDDNFDLEENTIYLNKLFEITNNAFSEYEFLPSGRPNSNLPLEEFINNLASLTVDLTGEMPGITYTDYTDPPSYTGQFYNFVETCLLKLGYKKFSNQGLGKQIQRCLELISELPHCDDEVCDMNNAL